MRPLAPTATALVLCAGLLTACSTGGDGPSTAQLQEDLDTQAQAQNALRQRITELEGELTAATSADDGTAELEARIGEIAEQIADLTRRLDEAAVTREDEMAETRAALSSLEAAVTELREEVDGLATELTKLREDHALLERRFENHSH